MWGWNEAGGALFKIREDPRVTRVGQVIRRQPILERRRHEEELIAIRADEVVAGHAHPPAAGSMTQVIY